MVQQGFLEWSLYAINHFRHSKPYLLMCAVVDEGKQRSRWVILGKLRRSDWWWNLDETWWGFVKLRLELLTTSKHSFLRCVFLGFCIWHERNSKPQCHVLNLSIKMSKVTSLFYIDNIIALYYIHWAHSQVPLNQNYIAASQQKQRYHVYYERAILTSAMRDCRAVKC